MVAILAKKARKKRQPRQDTVDGWNWYKAVKSSGARYGNGERFSIMSPANTGTKQLQDFFLKKPPAPRGFSVRAGGFNDGRMALHVTKKMPKGQKQKDLVIKAGANKYERMVAEQGHRYAKGASFRVVLPGQGTRTLQTRLMNKKPEVPGYRVNVGGFDGGRLTLRVTKL